jgi:DNA-directed RNA polymerase subunit E'/Rpb7
MAITGSSPNTQNTISEGTIILTNGHGTYIHANFTAHSYVAMGCEVINGSALHNVSTGL